MRERELRESLRSLRATGAVVEYRTCDVADEQAFGALIDEVYERHGRIDGVIHGAGLIEDRLVRDKERESLLRVMDAKAGAARTLAQRLREDSLRFLVLFGSVSGRFGNRGQSDYAAASEVLAKLAHELDRRWAARVVAIDWGPWRSAGMVSPGARAAVLQPRGAPDRARAGMPAARTRAVARRRGRGRGGARGGERAGRGAPPRAAGRRAPRRVPAAAGSPRAARGRGRERSLPGGLRVEVELDPRGTGTSTTTASTGAPCSRSRSRWS